MTAWYRCVLRLTPARGHRWTLSGRCVYCGTLRDDRHATHRWAAAREALRRATSQPEDSSGTRL